MKNKMTREELRKRVLSRVAVSPCTVVDLTDVHAEFFTHDQTLYFAWLIDRVDPGKVVADATFGFRLSGVAPSNQLFGYVGYDHTVTPQQFFGGDLEIPWTGPPPDAASTGFVEFDVFDLHGGELIVCGVELPITIRP